MGHFLIDINLTIVSDFLVFVFLILANQLVILLKDLHRNILEVVKIKISHLIVIIQNYLLIHYLLVVKIIVFALNYSLFLKYFL